LDGSYPKGAAWGVFGMNDDIGTLNLLTEERVRRAATLVRRGAVFSLNWSLQLPDPPLFGRRALKHEVHDLTEIAHPGTDDHYDDFYPQASSQWDSLAHIGTPDGWFYNGRKMSDILRGENTIDAWARRGIAGRFVLVDIAGARAASGQPLACDQRVEVGVEELEAVLAAQGTALEIGDILLLRFGWVGWYESLDGTARQRMAATPRFPAPGLACEERTAAWLWDHHVAAVASDTPPLEAWPPDLSRLDGFLHYRLIPLLGLAVGELFVLDPLAEDCARDGVYEGMFVSAPLNQPGGAGSSANALALK